MQEMFVNGVHLNCCHCLTILSIISKLNFHGKYLCEETGVAAH